MMRKLRSKCTTPTSALGPTALGEATCPEALQMTQQKNAGCTAWTRKAWTRVACHSDVNDWLLQSLGGLSVNAVSCHAADGIGGAISALHLATAMLNLTLPWPRVRVSIFEDKPSITNIVCTMQGGIFDRCSLPDCGVCSCCCAVSAHTQSVPPACA